MNLFCNHLFKSYYEFRYRRIKRFAKSPFKAQDKVFNNLIQASKYTHWGKAHGYRSIRKKMDFQDRVPVQDYESLKPFIRRMMNGEKDVLWPGQVTRYSKSSGTTNDKSKFIPVSDKNFKTCHIRGTWDTMTLFYHNNPESKIFAGRNFLMGGTWNQYKPHLKTIYGDVSALMMKSMPWVARPFFEPNFDLCFMEDWEEKIEKMAHVAIQPHISEMVTMVGGVPTWTNVFFQRILDISGKSHMLEVWPNFEAYIHGGVSILPYKEQLKNFLPSPNVKFVEVYNASEGYFATMFENDQDDMLLLLDNGVFYEFIPMDHIDEENPPVHTLESIKTGVNYAMVISTNAGLWRYKIGDTIQFTSLQPFRIKVTGRTQQFVNAFGEEVMVANTDRALAMTCRQTGVVVEEYTVAPIYFKGKSKGGHEWLIEFEEPPHNIQRFGYLLDKNLQKVNSDYEAKRYKDMALECLKIRPVPRGTFHSWLKAKGKFGSQHKIPRLANHRRYLEEILSI